MMPLTPADFAAFLQREHISAELIRTQDETPTVLDAARALGVSPDEIIKTLIFHCRGEAYSVITNGLAPVPIRPLADHFQAGKRQIKLASAQDVLHLTGYPVGGVPPLGHAHPLPVLLDRKVMTYPTVYGGGGDDRTMVRIATVELLRATEAELVVLS